MRSITFQERPSVDDLRESEAGLGQALGHGVDPPSGVVSALMGPLLRLFGKSSITVDETGITVGGRSRLWSEFGMTYETQNLLCVVITDTSGPLTIQKRALSAEQLEEVRQLISEHVQATPETIARITQIRTSRT